ncbi:MAG: hypothetical protein F6K65_13950 [Moorea sp. SIO3C2]|nr:hypothetical protein [Moorena sp. SIO3C2]
MSLLKTYSCEFSRAPAPSADLPISPFPDSRLPFLSWKGLGMGSDSRLPTA